MFAFIGSIVLIFIMLITSIVNLTKISKSFKEIKAQKAAENSVVENYEFEEKNENYDEK